MDTVLLLFLFIVLCVFRHLLQSLSDIIAGVDLHFKHEFELPVC